MKDQDMKNQEGKSQQQQDNTGKGTGVSGQNPGRQEGPVAGSAANTRGENTSGREENDAQEGQRGQKSPQGSNANPADTRGADSSDKEFRNNQPDASTQQEPKMKEGTGNDSK